MLVAADSISLLSLFHLISPLTFSACEAFFIHPMSLRPTTFRGALLRKLDTIQGNGKHRKVSIEPGSCRNHETAQRVELNACLSGSQKGIEESTAAATFDPIFVQVGNQPVLRIVPDDSKDNMMHRDSTSLPNVVIKPGFAWGDGAHPSTYMCLQFVCSTLVAHNFKNASVLDYGTGSGVLAIAAKKCGAGRVVGIDKDDEILTCAQENLDLNFGQGKGGIELVHGRDLVTSCKGVMLGESSSSTQFDLVVANMLPAALIRMAPTIVSAVREDVGVLALCGMRRDQVADVTAVYERNGVNIIEESSMVGSAPGLPPAEWVLLRGQVPRRSAEEERARLDFLSDAAIG